MTFYNQLKKDQSFVIKIFSTSLTRGVAAIGTFMFNFVLAKVLDSKDFGYFMLGYSILIGLGFMVRFGMTTAVMRIAGIMFANERFDHIRQLRQDVLYFSILLSVLIGGALIFSRSYIILFMFDSAEDVDNMLFLFALSLPFYAFLIIQSSFLKAFQKPVIAPLFEVGLTTFLTGVFVFLLDFFGVGINISISSIIFFLCSVIVCLLGFVTLNYFLKGKKESKFKEATEYKKSSFFRSLPDYALSDITNYILKFSPIIILGYYASGAEVGLFSIANSTAFIINFVLWIINTVYSPYFASTFDYNQKERLEQLVQSSNLYMIIIAGPIFFLIFLFPSEILAFFGEDFKEAKLALRILALAQLINTIMGSSFSLLNMTGHQKQLRNIVVLTAFISILASFILIPKMGFLGAAISTGIGLVLQNSLSLFSAKRLLKIKFFKFL